ncbi:MAG: hypothetical protein JRJ03_12435 [Deltaproteobacteria bacterium]|nr:hypothetical protein [Deltaproteobacteria bacterium]
MKGHTETEKKGISEEEREKAKAETEAQMLKTRVNDYLAIILAVGTVILLWFLQWMGFY